MLEKKIESNDINIVIETGNPKIAKLIDNSAYVKHLLPKFRKNLFGKFEGHYLRIRNGEEKYKETEKTIDISINTEKVEEGQMAFLLLHAVKKFSAEKNMFLAHGAALSKNQKGHLILGPSKSGKSHMALYESLERNFRIYGDDSIFIKSNPKEMIINSGNTYIGGRNYLKDPRLKDFSEGQYIDSYEAGINEDKPFPLKKVFFLEHDHFGTNPSKKMDNQRGKLYLYEHLSRESRSAGFCMFDSLIPLPPVDNFNKSQNLIKSIKESEIEYYSISGDYKAMVKDIESFSS